MRKILASLAAGSLVLPLSVVAGSATTADRVPPSQPPPRALPANRSP